ncbi:MAG: sensor histidine kinase [Flavipsychrobacter sp.]
MRLLVTLLLLLFATPCIAQDNTEDSLLNVIASADNNIKLQADIYSRLSYYQLGKNDKKAIVYSRHAIDKAMSGNHKEELAAAYISMCYAYDNVGMIDEGIAVVDSGLKIAQEIDAYRHQFWAEFMLASLKRRKANYNEAVAHALNALKIAEEHNDKNLQSSSYNGLGILFLNLGDLEKGQDYHLKALAIREELKDSSAISQSLNNLGIVQREKGNFDSSLYYYKKALAIAQQTNRLDDVAFLYNDIGAAYSKNGDVVNGEAYLKQSIEIREQIGEMNELAYTYNYLGENYERKGNLKLAEQNIKKALAIAIEIGNNKQHYEALESLSDFYSRNRIYDSAYSYLKQYRSFRDSISYMENKEIISELSTKYETEKKEKKIILQDAEITKRNYIIIGIVILLLLILLLGYSYYNRYRLRQQDRLQKAIIHQQELATKAVIEAEEKERKRIAGDLHDGVGQTMSAASMNLSVISNDIPFANEEQRSAFEKARLLVDEGCKEVRTVSHTIMPNALLKSGLATAIREFLHKIDAKVLKVNIYTEGLNERLPSNIETVLYRVVQECVNNTIKHAGADTLDITLIKDEDGISITIEDNGKGFDLKKIDNKDGIGLQNLQTRISYLNGTIEWDTAKGKGTVVSIHVDVN